MLSHDPLFIVAAIATLAVLAILMIGIGGFARGGDFNRKHANRIMRYRIIAQAIAVALIVLFVAVHKMRGN
jgi:mRNA-degrading endonuclease RelE of RelBE toxin-antitoxin system